RRDCGARKQTGRSAMTPRMTPFGVLAFVLFWLAGFGGAAALDYPTRPVRWIVPYPAGGTTDILARIIGQYLSEELGQQCVVGNRPGGGNNIRTDAGVHAATDGYT